MVVLRILNGPLFGTDIVVPADGCFVRVVDLDSRSTDISIEEGIDQWSNDAIITIPLPGGSPNFRLIPIVDQGANWTLQAEIYVDDTGAEQVAVVFNEPFVVGALQIAVRRSDDVWADSVLHSRISRDLVHIQEVSTLPDLPASFRRRRLAATFSTVISAAALAALVWFVWPLPAPAENVANLLNDGSYQVVEGENRQAYVFVNSADSVGGVTRRLIQAGIGDVQVMVRTHEAERIGRWLYSSNIPYFAVDLNDPQHPVLRLRHMTISKPVIPADFNARLREIAPYVQAVQVQWRTEDDARRAARFLVEEIGARASYRTTPGHFIAAVDDYLSDSQLDAFSRALGSYQRVWGRDYAQFEISQRDLLNLDGLRTGRFTYELRSARHVYFPPS